MVTGVMLIIINLYADLHLGRYRCEIPGTLQNVYITISGEDILPQLINPRRMRARGLR